MLWIVSVLCVVCVGGYPRFLTAHNHAHELLVVDVALLVLHVGQQLLHLLIGQLFAERGQQVAQLGRGDVATGVLVEVTQSLDEIVGRVSRPGLRNSLVDGQEDLERNALIGLQLVGALLHIRLGGVLAQGPEALAHLAELDLAIATVVKEIEGLLEFCIRRKTYILFGFMDEMLPNESATFQRGECGFHMSRIVIHLLIFMTFIVVSRFDHHLASYCAVK